MQAMLQVISSNLQEESRGAQMIPTRSAEEAGLDEGTCNSLQSWRQVSINASIEHFQIHLKLASKDLFLSEAPKSTRIRIYTAMSSIEMTYSSAVLMMPFLLCLETHTTVSFKRSSAHKLCLLFCPAVEDTASSKMVRREGSWKKLTIKLQGEVMCEITGAVDFSLILAACLLKAHSRF